MQTWQGHIELVYQDPQLRPLVNCLEIPAGS